MSDLLNIASVAANTFKKAIEVTSHNVSNVSTDGYHRQRADIVSNAPQINGGSFLGGGARVDTVARVYSQGMQEQLTTAYSLKSRFEEQTQMAKQVEGVIASNNQGVQTFMQSFYDAAQGVANNPTDNVSRQLMLDQSTSLQSHVTSMAVVLKDTNNQINDQLDTLATSVNTQLETIHKINQAVVRAQNTGTQPPNDLLDKREQAIYDLGQNMDIKTFYQKDGSIEVYTGNGRIPLVNNHSMTKLQSVYSEYHDENRKEIHMNIGGEDRDVSNQITGGKIGATMDARNNALDASMDQLGVVINGTVASTNWQHYQGYDLNDDAGEHFFKPLDTTAMGSVKNTGAEDGSNIKISFNPPPPAGVTTKPPYDGTAGHTQPNTYGDKQDYLANAEKSMGELKNREYKIISDGGNPASFQFKDYKTGEDITSSAVETPAGSGKYQLEGLEFDMSAIQNSGTTDNLDHYIVKPHQVILSQFEMVITDANTLATRGQSPIDSNGDGSLDDETPAAAAYGDNVNIANIANIAGKKLLYSDANNLPSETMLGGYAKMASNLGLYVQSTDIQLQTQTNVFDNAYARSQSLSGVNLDEEAANLMRFQQAYQAAAKLISTTQQMFTTLLQSIR